MRCQHLIHVICIYRCPQMFSEQHKAYLKCCWPRLVRESNFIRSSHVMIFSNHNPVRKPIDNETLDTTRSLFEDHGISFEYKFPKYEELPRSKRFNYRYQRGANLGLELGFAQGWFEPYEWLVRINPDVLIRNSTWMMDIMTKKNKKDSDNDKDVVDGIFHICSRTRFKLHADFFAVRVPALIRHEQEELGIKESMFSKKNTTDPNASTVREYKSTLFSQMWPEYNPNSSKKPPPKTKADAAIALKRGGEINHERTVYETFRFLIESSSPSSSRVVFVPNVDDSENHCRIRGRKLVAPIYHQHDSCIDDHNNDNTNSSSSSLTCNALVDWPMIQ